MKKYRINYIVLLFIIFSEMGSSAKLKPGDKAPPFSLIKLENQEYVKSEDYLGKKNLVICFFSSWSRSFNKHFPQLINISEKYDKNTEVVFIAVKEKKPLINKYITKLGISIHYAAFPRSGIGTESFTKMVGAWCSEDPKKSITNLKNGENLRLNFIQQN